LFKSPYLITKLFGFDWGYLRVPIIHLLWSLGTRYFPIVYFAYGVIIHATVRVDSAGVVVFSAFMQNEAAAVIFECRGWVVNFFVLGVFLQNMKIIKLVILGLMRFWIGIR